MNATIGLGVFVTAEGGLPESTALPLYGKRITDQEAQVIIRSARCEQLNCGLRPRTVESGSTADLCRRARYLLDIRDRDSDTDPIDWVDMNPRHDHYAAYIASFINEAPLGQANNCTFMPLPKSYRKSGKLLGPDNEYPLACVLLTRHVKQGEQLYVFYGDAYPRDHYLASPVDALLEK